MEEIYKILNQLHPEFNFKKSNNFVAEGLLNSFDVVLLVSELENTFDCIIDGLDILPENFDTIESIINVVKKNGGSIKL